jgi:hypothetical protein
MTIGFYKRCYKSCFRTSLYFIVPLISDFLNVTYQTIIRIYYFAPGAHNPVKIIKYVCII